jgi:hypothetical protein
MKECVRVCVCVARVGDQNPQIDTRVLIDDGRSTGKRMCTKHKNPIEQERFTHLHTLTHTHTHARTHTHTHSLLHTLTHAHTHTHEKKENVCVRASNAARVSSSAEMRV